MFEAIHGSAPRMVQEGRAQYADPSSVTRAAAMLLNHVGYPQLGNKLEMALDICGQFEKKLKITGRNTAARVGISAITFWRRSRTRTWKSAGRNTR